MWHEARNQPLGGIVAVGDVIRNRINDPRYPKDACRVIMQPGQFSFVKNGRIPPAPANADDMRALARAVLQNQVHSPAASALFFRHASLPPEPGRKPLKQIGDHRFYR